MHVLNEQDARAGAGGWAGRAAAYGALGVDLDDGLFPLRVDDEEGLCAVEADAGVGDRGVGVDVARELRAERAAVSGDVGTTRPGNGRRVGRAFGQMPRVGPS